MQVTMRDIDLFRWVNRFGFVSIEHVASYWKTSEKVVYRRMLKLVKSGYMDYEKLLYKVPGVYSVTRMGIEIGASDLPVVKNVNLATLGHQLMIVTVYLRLSQYQERKIKTEREIMVSQSKNNIGARPHVPDLLIEDESQKTAIEIELSTKGRNRLVKILNQYRKDFSIKEVLYLCGNNEVFNQLSREAENYSFLKVHSLNKWLADNHHG